MPDLQTEIKFLAGVGPQKAEVLNKEAQIFTLEDLLYYFPFRYVDRTKFYKVSELTGDMPNVQLRGVIRNFVSAGEGRKQRLTAQFADDSGTLELIWFQGIKWVKQNIKSGNEYVIFGKPNVYGSKLNIAHPEIEEISTNEAKPSALEAAYNTTEKMKSKFLNSKAILKLQTALFKLPDLLIPETLPAYFLKKHNLMNLTDALFQVHFPEDLQKLKKARFRIKFEELFYLQLNILSQKLNRNEKSKGFVFSKVGDFFNGFYTKNLPFPLTEAQKRVLKEIRRDFGSGKQCNRLLQGDVGSGKTLVALMSMLIAADNGFQSALMAPTEILAQQHFESLSVFLKGLDIRVALLTGSSKTKIRRKLHEELESGQIHILIGTHALIEDVVVFKNLGLAIIDEQHRFGVEQRSKLWRKNTLPPHIVVMTATPIPRTLAMTVYGDLEVSVIDELPPGRKPVKTVHAYDSQRLRVFKFLREQIALGRQIYIVYPLITESENFDYKDLEDGLESISRVFPPPEFALSVVHGRMKPEEKDKAMQLFVKGITQIMIATTVIEVGVNVPNASVMIIENAERFGLSQMHQLRGRVGRGADQSYCILMTPFKLSKEARLRINTMCATNDGFEISEVDMKMRGPGDMQGTQQSGIPMTLRMANLATDGDLVQLVRDAANEVLKSDPTLELFENQILQKQLKKHFRKPQNWETIS